MDESLELQNKNIGIWIRVSTEDQARGDSPEHHEIRARKYAESKGWQVKDVYHLEAVSGKSVMEHPETIRMLDDIRSGKIKALIFSKLARLARNTRELLDFADMFRDNNADLISLQESIDTSTPVGRMFYTVIAAMAQWEREEISDRVKASVSVRAQLGKPLGGKAPFGYHWIDNQLIPNPKEVPLCKKIFEVFLEQRRLKTTARILNESGYRSSRGAKFCDSQIRRILTNPVSKGLHRSNYTKSKGDKRNWDLKPENEWVYNEVEAIVSTELWDQCNHILIEQSKKRKPPAKKTVQLFGGLTICSCGHKMYVPNNTPKYVCKKCRNKIPIVDLESIYIEQLKDFFISPDEVSNLLQSSDVEIQVKEALIDTLIDEQQSAKREIDNLFKLYGDEKISSDQFGEANAPLYERYKQLQEEIPTLQGEVDFLKINHLSSDQVVTEAKDLYSRWPKLDFEDKRTIVENITETIVIGKDNIDINLCYLPTYKVVSKGQHNNRVALPFYHLTLSFDKPKSSAYPISLQTIGDHIRKRRLDLELFQKHVAQRIGVATQTVTNWEKNITEPEIRHLPKVIDFLGYNLLPKPKTFVEKLTYYRLTFGLSMDKLSEILQIDPGTIWDWEQGNHKPTRKLRERIEPLIKL